VAIIGNVDANVASVVEYDGDFRREGERADGGDGAQGAVVNINAVAFAATRVLGENDSVMDVNTRFIHGFFLFVGHANGATRLKHACP
jgi:hypothetical protein